MKISEEGKKMEGYYLVIIKFLGYSKINNRYLVL